MILVSRAGSNSTPCSAWERAISRWPPSDQAMRLSLSETATWPECRIQFVHCSLSVVITEDRTLCRHGRMGTEPFTRKDVDYGKQGMVISGASWQPGTGRVCGRGSQSASHGRCDDRSSRPLWVTVFWACLSACVLNKTSATLRDPKKVAKLTDYFDIFRTQENGGSVGFHFYAVNEVEASIYVSGPLNSNRRRLNWISSHPYHKRLFQLRLSPGYILCLAAIPGAPELAWLYLDSGEEILPYSTRKEYHFQVA